MDFGECYSAGGGKLLSTSTSSSEAANPVVSVTVECQSKVDSKCPPPEIKHIDYSKILGMNLPAVENVPTPLETMF